MYRCPGQDTRFWRRKDIFDVKCSCGRKIEFWKDDPYRICPQCTHVVRNPRLNQGCAAWCPAAHECTAPAIHNPATKGRDHDDQKNNNNR